MAAALAGLREALLAQGSDGLDRTALAVRLDHQIVLGEQSVMGILVPKVDVQPEAPGIRFGVGGTSALTDAALARFVETLKVLGELAELENAVLRLARELRKTQRRCNALSKIFIPNYSETIDYIVGSLEERERESVIIMKMIKARLSAAVEGSVGYG
jgi:V/A-type H+-transporting ATPase subunit D